MKGLATFVLVTLVSSASLGQNTSSQNGSSPSNLTEKICSSPGGNASPGAKPQPCTSPRPASPSAAQQFPYPGEAPATDAEHPAGQTTSPPAVPSTPKEFPYPGESSSSSSSSSADNTGDADPTSTSRDPLPSPPGGDVSRAGSIRRKLPKPQRMQSDEDREAEDLSVAKFYRQSGNVKAAYLRTKDAVKMQPDDPVAHFALAETARLLDKRDEAAAEYNAYLKLEPDGDHVKDAQKALVALK